MPDKSEDLSLGVDLDKPEEESEIVTSVEAMPESANHKDPELGEPTAFERRSLIDAFPEPLLDCDVPVGNFIPDVFIGFDHYRTACVDQFELLSVVGYPTRVNTCNT